MNENTTHHTDFLQGQIEALRALILGLAQDMPKEEFRRRSLERLELLHTALLDQPVGEKRLEGVELMTNWVRHVTG